MSDPESPLEPPDALVLPEQPGAIAARFSIDEVAQLAALLGLTPPPSVADAVLAMGAFGTTASADDTIAGIVRRGLFARGVIELGPDDALHMDDDALAILATICRPGLVVTVNTDRRTVSQRRTVYARPGGAIVETPRRVGGQGVMDYMSLPLESLLPSLVQWTGVDSRSVPLPEARPFTVIAGDAARAGEAIAAGDQDTAVAILSASARSPESAAGATVYVRALAGHVSSNSVTVLHRAEDQLAVGLISWNDCGDGGLWLLEQDDALALYEQNAAEIADDGEPADPAELDALVLGAPVTFSPISGEELLQRLSAALGD